MNSLRPRRLRQLRMDIELVFTRRVAAHGDGLLSPHVAVTMNHGHVILAMQQKASESDAD
jgi:hypothetical protein